MRGAWEGGKCGVPMWIAGIPSGACEEVAYGPQYPREVLAEKNSRYLIDRPVYCPRGPCCPKHGGPQEGEPIVFQDGLTDRGRPMYCAVLPDFINLQESPAGFDGNGVLAIKKLMDSATVKRPVGRPKTITDMRAYKAMKAREYRARPKPTTKREKIDE